MDRSSAAIWCAACLDSIESVSALLFSCDLFEQLYCTYNNCNHDHELQERTNLMPDSTEEFYHNVSFLSKRIGEDKPPLSLSILRTGCLRPRQQPRYWKWSLQTIPHQPAYRSG